MYCDSCGDDRQFAREQRDQTIHVRGEDVTVSVSVLVCPECGDVQPDPVGEDPLRLAYNEYRCQHGLLAPQRIRDIREQYGLSHEAFAALLGMSPATLYRYEGGALQDELQDSMIFACENPATMERLVNRRRDRLSALQYKRFIDAMARLATIAASPH
jgi:putative zinc finger/helix-turn-helix YgiT family protein